MPKEDAELDTETLETPDEGNETEADAGTQSEQGQDGDDGEDAAEGDGSQAEVEGEEVAAAAEERPRSRAENRFQRLSNETKEAREEAARLRRELDEFKAAQRQSQPQETPEQEAQRLALMTPEERLEYRLDKAERRNQQNMQAIMFQTQDTADKAAFAALCASDPLAKRYADAVESELVSIRSKGQNVTREALLTFLVGKEVRAKGGAAKRKQQGEGQRRIERQTVRGGNSKGDSQPNKRGEQSLEDKLANVTF